LSRASKPQHVDESRRNEQAAIARMKEPESLHIDQLNAIVAGEHKRGEASPFAERCQWLRAKFLDL